ncbi:MAG: hypothetical protein GY859_13545, partial [Desulfobacterales bacterium]|nr:hypothetical protein [Desulfobacterales bacterium]
MKNEEIILERLDRLEKQIAPIAGSARAVGELREELGPRVNEAVQALIGQLEEVESDFQLEDLLYLIKKAMRNVNNLSYSLDQLKNIIDFVNTAEPLFKTTVPQAILFLDELERMGVFNIFRICMDTLKRISETYTAEDMEQFGNGLVLLLGVAKKLTTP